MASLSVILISIGVFALFFILISVRILLKKGGEFQGTCASQSPFLNKEGVTCNLCGKTVSVGDVCSDPLKSAQPLTSIGKKNETMPA